MPRLFLVKTDANKDIDIRNKFYTKNNAMVLYVIENREDFDFVVNRIFNDLNDFNFFE
jgi:hypothetical protein